MKWYFLLPIFLVLNFAALGIGSIFTDAGVSSGWYQSLNKAPWTPPGWVFGAAWTTIMICFAVYMMYAWNAVRNRNHLITLYILQWVLNVSWNPIFFRFHDPVPALFIIVALTVLLTWLMLAHWSSLKLKSLLIAPYIIWLLIATSLNAYIVFNNETTDQSGAGTMTYC
ncbi:MAG TPA: TspO/MBR family protein [Ohtaekwangia sp.]